MNVACGNLNSYNFFRVFIESQMKFAPDPSSTASMLVDVPLPCSVDPKTGGSNDNVTRPAQLDLHLVLGTIDSWSGGTDEEKQPDYTI